MRKDYNNIDEAITDFKSEFIFTDLSVCATNDIKSDKLKLYELFSNLDCLIGVMSPDDTIIDMLIKKEAIDVFKIWRYPKTSYRVVEKSLFFKGCRWNECPKPIQDHFQLLKELRK